MVKRTRRKWSACIMAGYATAGTAVGIGGTPAFAQERPGSLLERMQDEVASVARQSRAAIVTIEDSRAVTLDYFHSALHKTDMEEQIAQVLAEKKAADANVARQQARFDAGTATVQDLAKPRAEQAVLEARLSTLRQQLAISGQEKSGTEQDRDLQSRVSFLQAELNNLDEAVRIDQGRTRAGLSHDADPGKLEGQRARVQQQLDAARQRIVQKTTPATLPSTKIFGYGADSQSTPPRAGSGFSIGDSLIVTTADVVQGMSNPVVTTDDGRQVRANVVAVDSRLNIALLRLSANLNLPALRLGDSANVAPGHFAITMGNQTGQANSVALSTISALRTQGTTSAAHYYPELLQIDGTVSAGTSGAPVLNARGEVIGMLAATPAATSIADASGFTPGMSYRYEVSPSQNLRLKALSDAVTPLRVLPATPNTKLGTTTLNGLLAAPPSVQPAPSAVPPARSTPETPTKPADKAIVPKSEDRRTQVFGTTGPTTKLEYKMTPSLTSPNIIYKALDAPYNIYRASESPFYTPTAISLPASSSSGYAIPVNAMKSVLDELKTGHNVVHAWLGMRLEDADNARYENGIVSVDRQVKIAGVYDRSPASKAGLKPTGDILVGLNDIAVHTSNDVRSAVLLRFKPGQSVTAHLMRAGKSLDVPLTLEASPTDVPPLLNAGNAGTSLNLQLGHARKSP